MNKLQKIILSSVLLVIAGILGFYFVFYFPKTTITNTYNWKTYQDNTYGFEAKYPNSYSTLHSSGDTDIDFGTKKECEALLNTATTVFPIDCQDYTISIQKNTPIAEGYDYTHSPITVAGIQGEKITSPTSLGNWENIDQVVVWFQKGNNWYIQTFTYNHQKSQAAEGVMNQILASFKFVK